MRTSRTRAMMARLAGREEGGSALVAVLVVLLVLSLLAGTLAAVVTNTAHGLTVSRESIQSRAAADAGIAAAVAAVRASTSSPCARPDLPGTDPTYVVEFNCPTAGELALSSRGKGERGTESVVDAVYALESVIANDIGSDSHMTFFGSATFTYETQALSTGLLNIALASGDFTCQATVDANIIVAGSFKGNGSCHVMGSVIAGGTVSTTNKSDLIEKNVVAASVSESRFPGTVKGNFTAGGPVTIDMGATGQKVQGKLRAGGNVRLYDASVTGDVSLPVGKTVCVNGSCSSVVGPAGHAQIGGSLVNENVAAPAAPQFATWFDYVVPSTGTAAYATWAAAQWPGYTTWVPSATECANLNTGSAPLWNMLTTRITSATIVDARSCANSSDGVGFLTSNNGSQKSVTLGSNVVFLANGFHLSSLTIKPATGTSPKVWFVVPDAVDNNQPLSAPPCWGANRVDLNNVNITVSAMAYTPGCVKVSGGGTWTGAIYGGAFNYGGALQFWGQSIALPGMPSSITNTGTGVVHYVLGGLLSQRDF